ncbi:nucleotidyltransferase [Desulfitobacterium hafniense]|uniref:Nucleotidyltransferase n=2 Tax=Desulfitobacterium TaxID=36853 RepID=A0A0W1JEL7_DESHA|nr:nucleotidyltransferase [Desulfitobacterium hafniense]
MITMSMDVAEIKDKLFPIFEAAPIYQAILFGSFAQNKATDSSDVDIVIDSRGELLNIKFYGVLEDITQTLGRKVDLFEISEIRPGSPIDYEIRQQGVLLYDR